MKIARMFVILTVLFLLGCEMKDYGEIEKEIYSEQTEDLEDNVKTNTDITENQNSDDPYLETSVATSIGLSMQVLDITFESSLEHVDTPVGYKNVLIDVVLKNESSSDYHHLETYEFYLHDEYDMTYFFESKWYDSPMQYAMIAPKGVHRGTLLYQVPSDREDFTLQYFYLEVPLADFVKPISLLTSEFQGFTNVEHKMGDIVESTDFTLQIIQVEKSKETAANFIHYDYDYVFVDLILVNHTNTESNYNINNFRLAGSEGNFCYPVQYFWQSTSGTLVANERQWIQLVFERSLEEDWYVLLYQPEYYTDEVYFDIWKGVTDKEQIGDLVPNAKITDLVSYQEYWSDHLYTVQITEFEIRDEYYVLKFLVRNEGEELKMPHLKLNLVLPHNYDPEYGELDREPTVIQDSSYIGEMVSKGEVVALTNYFVRPVSRERGNHYYVAFDNGTIIDLEDSSNTSLIQ